MDVDQAHFHKRLLGILGNIANATFVTFDLEMSGITTRPKYSSGDRSHDVGKPSLQQQYEEMKSAAESFQILQMGLTCVEEDREKDFYLARPYNFNMTPLSADSADKKGGDLRLERVVAFSSSACDFLRKYGFDFGRVFSHGVPYLSRSEEDACREEYNQRADRMAKIEEIPLSLKDTETMEFYRGARATITDWLKNPKVPFVNVDSPDGPLNGFQRRLIYQLARKEFPMLQCRPRNEGSFMQLTVLNLRKEAEFQAEKLIEYNDRIGKQKGLRWIFEALAGGDLSGIDPEWFASKSSNKPEDQLPYIKAELAQIIATLRTKKHFLVGHNIFTDLGFIYNAFVGRLPANVEEFQKEIHFLFPTVIDTKYLASHGADSMNPRANLKDLLDPFRKVHIPLIVLHEQHTAYGGSGKEHEAGFDSWMTAELFVKLSAKLYSTYDGTSTDGSAFTEESAITNESAYVSGSAYFSASADTLYYSDDDDDSPGGGAFLNSRSATPSPKKNASKVDARSGSHSAALPSGNLNAGPLSGISISTQTQSKSSAYSGSLNGGLLAGLSMSSQFQPTVNTGSGALKNGSLSALSTSSQSTITAGTRSSGGVTVNTVNGNSSSAKSAVPKPILNTKIPTPTISRREPTNHASMVMQDNLPPVYHAKLLDPSAITLQDNDEDTNAVRQEPFVQQWIPRMEHLFWGPYVNKLRVNAAEGGVCELAAEEK